MDRFEQEFDVRIVERLIAKKIVKKADYDKHLAKLPDMKAKATRIAVQQDTEVEHRAGEREDRERRRIERQRDLERRRAEADLLRRHPPVTDEEFEEAGEFGRADAIDEDEVDEIADDASVAEDNIPAED